MSKIHTWKKRAWGLVCGFCLMAIQTMPVYAGSTLLTGADTGSLSIYQYAGTDTSRPLSGVEFSAYRILEIHKDGNTLDYKIPDNIQDFYAGELGSGVTAEDVANLSGEAFSQMTDKLKAYIEEKQITPYQISARTNGEGYTKMDRLELGCYLILETAAPSNVEVRSSNFVVPIPMTNRDGTGWIYDITAYPKNTVSSGNGGSGGGGGGGGTTGGHRATTTIEDTAPPQGMLTPDPDILIPDQEVPMGIFDLPKTGGWLSPGLLLGCGMFLMLLSMSFMIWLERERKYSCLRRR